MVEARLAVTIPEGPWIADVSRRYPESSFRVLSAFPAREDGNERGFALLEVHGDDLDSLIEDIRAHETILECSVLQRTDAVATLQVRTSTPMILLAARRAGMPVEMPVEIQNGTATVDITGTHERLAELGEQFEGLGLSFEVEYIQERLHPEQLLSHRQQELLLTALEHGYYDTPRQCTLTELADALDLAKSTCSETLHRAEEIVIKEFADRFPQGTAADSRLLVRDSD